VKNCLRQSTWCLPEFADGYPEVVDERSTERSGVSDNPTRGIRFGNHHSYEPVPDGTGMGPPVPEWVDVSHQLDRWFAFIDISGFTTYTEDHGTEAALGVLARFRSVVRQVTARRGVRVLKWLGDGVMIVGVEPGPLVAAVCEISTRFDHDAIDVHAGVAGGPVLLFEGDDYVGPSANHAARLCDAAGPGEVLGLDVTGHLPDWVQVDGHVVVGAEGIGELRPVARLSVRPEARPAVRPATVA
jgi:adenylate cyclase